MRSLLLTVILLLVAASAAVRVTASPIDLAAMARIADLEEPAIAPHGGRVALIASVRICATTRT